MKRLLSAWRAYRKDAGGQRGRTEAKTLIILGLIIVITVLHYTIPVSRIGLHNLFRRLYYIPIIASGLSFGLKGGMLCASLVTILYLPFILISWHGNLTDYMDKLYEILLFCIIAIVTGKLVDKKREESERVKKAENLALLGQAAATIAHELKTPLIAIGGFARLIKRKLEKQNTQADKLEIIIKETQRLEALVKEMLDFSKPYSPQPALANINQLVEEVIDMYREKANGCHVTVQGKLSWGLPDLYVDRPRIKQVLINLIDNAIEVSKPGQSVSVTTTVDDNNLLIQVNDYGTGIPPENRVRLFTPFFTSKKTGTGLGLAISRKIADAHQGRLNYESAESGTTFALALPLTRPEG